MYKKFIVGALTASLMVPAAALAQSTSTSTSTEAQIQSLLSQIRALQAQLMALLASSSSTRPIMMNPGQLGKAACIRFERNIGHGSSGEDVKKLQELLKEDAELGFNVSPTGFFGPMTARAMAKFQMRFGIASSTDGTVGPLTRGFFERACGQGLGEKPDPREIRGEITSTGSSSITVTPLGGQPRVVNITASTTIRVMKTASSTERIGSMADLTVGTLVKAEGTANADGSLTAKEIKVGIEAKLEIKEWNPKDFMEKLRKSMLPGNRGPGSWNSGKGSIDDDDDEDEEEDEEDDDSDDDEEDEGEEDDD